MPSSVLLPDFAVYFFYCFLSFGAYKVPARFVCVVCCGFRHAGSRKNFFLGTVRQFTFLSRFSCHPFQPLLPPACAGKFNSQRLGDFVCLYFLCVCLFCSSCVSVCLCIRASSFIPYAKGLSFYLIRIPCVNVEVDSLEPSFAAW